MWPESTLVPLFRLAKGSHSLEESDVGLLPTFLFFPNMNILPQVFLRQVFSVAVAHLQTCIGEHDPVKATSTCCGVEKSCRKVEMREIECGLVAIQPLDSPSRRRLSRF